MGTLMSLVIALAATRAGAAQGMPQGTNHEQHMAQVQHDAEMKKRGAMAMGFDQDKTAHHFALADDGGSIEVSVKDPADTASRDAIRAHLQEIAKAFAAGDFEKPLMTHGEEPSGVPAMKRLKAAISYTYEETADGGRVRISTKNAEALNAVHEFLRYQIREHKTQQGAGHRTSRSRSKIELARGSVPASGRAMSAVADLVLGIVTSIGVNSTSAIPIVPG